MEDKRLPKVDIVIITWNSYKYLKSCLDSIERYTKDIDYRLIIIDNGSTDKTKQYLNQKISEKVIVKRNKINLGYPKALLLGYEISTTENVCLMNDDVVVSPRWLSNLLKVMKENPKIGILGPVRPGADFIHPYTKGLSKAVLEQSKKRYKSPQGQLKFFTFGKDYLTFVKDFKKANRPRLVCFDNLPHIVSTCCALVRRRVVQASGGIVDTSFVKYGGDDVDLCWRLIASGFKLGITSASYAHHFEHVSITKNKVDRQKYLKINARRLFNKWEEPIKEYLRSRTKDGLTREQILQESWLLQRLSDAVGGKFWVNV
jgi:GT2 family glycosyltransferase